MSTESVADLLRRGKEAVINNDYATGRTLLTQVVQLDPQNEQGWLWLSGLLNNPERMRFCLERVIQINPDNVHAQAALEDLERKARGGRTSQRMDVGGGPTRHIPRRPESMVEGESVAALAQAHNRIRWGYIGVWSLIWALHLILWRRQVAGPQPTLGMVAASAALLALAQSGAWMLFLNLIRRTQAAHTLRRSTINDAISLALWPSGLLALLALLFGAWMQGDASMSAIGDLVRSVLMLVSLGLLLRGILSELAPNLHERPARQALGRAFLAFVGCWGLTMFVGWNVLSTLLGA